MSPKLYARIIDRNLAGKELIRKSIVSEVEVKLYRQNTKKSNRDVDRLLNKIMAIDLKII